MVNINMVWINIGFGAGGGDYMREACASFELRPLVCIVCIGKVITLTQQFITQVTKVTTNSQ